MAKKRKKGHPKKHKNPQQDSEQIAQNIEQEVLLETKKRKTKQLAIGSVVLIIGLVILGIFTNMLGVGPFGYRVLRYGSNQLFLYNHTNKWVFVTIDEGETFEVEPLKTKWIPIIGGTSHIVTTDEDEKLLEEFDVFTDNTNQFYHIEFNDSVCIVRTDVTPYYVKSKDKGMKIVQKIFPSERIFPIPRQNVILPQKTFPDKLAGDTEKVFWIETVNCILLEEGEGIILELLQTRFRDRRKRYLEEKEHYKKTLERQGQW